MKYACTGSDEAVFKPSADVHDFDFKRDAIVGLQAHHDIR
jgi:hypothetical protein